MNPWTVQELIAKLPPEIRVNEHDKQVWLDNPCTIVFRLAAISLVYDTFHQMMTAKNMNDVCEVRGMYRALELICDIPNAIHTVESGGITREQADEVRQKIEDFLNANRNR
jgi:hypothetical protein